MELPTFLRVWQLVAIACWSVHNHTWSRPNGNLQLSLQVRDSEFTFCHSYYCGLLYQEKTVSAMASPVLGKSVFNHENRVCDHSKVIR